ncbi:MAG: glycosyltransferase, partial [Chloroflexi bacterium]|nr:glycosyltransferase [Chloroflexota bacterium]
SFIDFPTLAQVALITTKLSGLIRPSYPSHPPVQAVREVDWLSTAYMLFRRDALDQVGCVDEEFFIYSDESDLQYRLKKAGWKIYYLPEVKTIHFGGKSLTPWRRRRLVYRGYLLFFKKHYGRLQTVALRGLFAAASFVKLVAWSLLFIQPKMRERAVHELKSNGDIFVMTLKPGIEPP